jgi:hypothetical protein
MLLIIIIIVIVALCYVNSFVDIKLVVLMDLAWEKSIFNKKGRQEFICLVFIIFIYPLIVDDSLLMLPERVH